MSKFPETTVDLTANLYGVQKKQWKYWRNNQRRVFNNVFFEMQANQSLFKHPKDPVVTQTYWDTTCWNAAWIAADAAGE